MIAGFYAGILALIQIVLTVRVILLRFKHKVLVGDKDEQDLRLRVRIHGNFVETVPIALLLILILDLNLTAPWILHVLGVGLVSGRLFHAYGFSAWARDVWRRAGMALTLAVIMVAALLCILQGLT